MSWGTCKLCDQKKLLIKAHIIPEWMYAPLYDEKHKMFTFTTGNDPKRAGRISSGEYDKDILCSHCDNSLGVFENYGRSVFVGSKILTIHSRVEGGVTVHRVNDFDYKKFKLFLLSILWKASISKRENYKLMEMDNGYRESMKKMILSGDPGSQDDIAVNIIALHSAEAHQLEQLIIPPYSGNGLHIFLISGYLFIFAKSAKALPHPPFCLKQSGEIDIINTGPEDAYTLLEKMYGLNWLRPV